MRADRTVRLAVAQEAMVWRAQAATTEAAFASALNTLAENNEPAAGYIRALRPERWALFPHFRSTPLYGWRTTNFVESEQARSLKLKPRKLLPFEYFRTYANILMGESYKRLRLAAEWSASIRSLTPRAESKLQLELTKIPSYSVAFSSDDVCYVSHRSSPFETNIEVCIGKPHCPCALWMQHGIPCVHMLAALQEAGKMSAVPALFAPCYTTAAYSEYLRPIRLPSDDALQHDATIQPAPHYEQAGRPRKRRIRSRGEKGSRAMYRCERCGSRDGHNRATCRYK